MDAGTDAARLWTARPALRAALSSHATGPGCGALRALGRLEGLVDGRNCRLPDAEVQGLFEPTLRAYAVAEGALTLRAEPASDVAAWLLDAVDGGVLAGSNLRKEP